MPELAPRSYLFVPGNRPELAPKAIGSGADVVVVDLEDAVSAAEKPAARAALGAWRASCPGAIVVRVNGVHTPWFAEDIASCRDIGLSTVMLPKAESETDLIACTQRTPQVSILPLIETARGIYHVVAIAQHPATARLVFGSLDLQLDLGISTDDDSLLSFRSQLVLASRLGNLPAPVDGVCLDLVAGASLHADAERARRLGFGAKLCIHPTQVAVVNAAFLPTADELLWARRVVQAAALSKGAATKVDGRMVDRPIILRAEAIIAESERRGRGDSRPSGA